MSLQKRGPKSLQIILSILLVFGILITSVGCLDNQNETASDPTVSSAVSTVSESSKAEETESAADSSSAVVSTQEAASEIQTSQKQNNSVPDNEQASVPLKEKTGGQEFQLKSVPKYSSSPYAVVNENVPFFTSYDRTVKSFEKYSVLDAKGRCGAAYACIGKDLMPTEDRGDIGQVKPSGWQLAKYDCVSGKYLYNRCHLIGYQLTGENANERNLITGTRYLNIEGMLPFENMTADYIKETGNHVLYRVTPMFDGNNLVATGVLMEGYSVEDGGDGICFNVFCYNVQPGITINYADGTSRLNETAATSSAATSSKATSSKSTSSKATTSAATSSKATSSTASKTSSAASSSKSNGKVTYIVNTNKSSMKFHYPDCPSVDRMKESNKLETNLSREELIKQGYSPCKNCNP